MTLDMPREISANTHLRELDSFFCCPRIESEGFENPDNCSSSALAVSA